MNDLPDAIYRRWGHSFEEDRDGVTVYRPAGYAFPRARGRAGIEFRPDGEFIDWRIGRGDARQAVLGRWSDAGGGRVRISFEGGDRAPQELEIVECGEDILRIRSRPAGS
jgi:hypothetical protein